LRGFIYGWKGVKITLDLLDRSSPIFFGVRLDEIGRRGQQALIEKTLNSPYA